MRAAAHILLRASSHVLCDRPSLPLVEQSLRQNRSQLMRMPQVHCAESYLSTDMIDLGSGGDRPS